MKQHSRYVFGAALSTVIVAGAPGFMHQANAAVSTVAQFTFENNGGTLSGTSTSVTTTAGALFGPFLADSGAGSAYGSHVSTSGYSTPAGNGSAHSFSSNDWTVGDYYQFNVPTTAITGVLLNFSQTSSGTGPAQFTLQYSVDGSNYSDFASYSIPLNSGSTAGFSPTTTNTLLQFSFDLSGVTGLNNNPNAAFRLVDNSTAAYNGTTSVAAGGTDRVDDFTVSGNTSIPEPASVSLLTAAASLALLRRRNK